MGQVTSVAKGFWIPPTSSTLLVFGLVAPFTYKFEDVPYPWQAIASLVALVALIALTFAVRTWRHKIRGTGPLLQVLAVFVLTLGFGLAFSHWVQPVFMPRYMMTCAALLLLATAVAIAGLPKASLSALATVLFVALNAPAWLRIQTQTFNGPFALLADEVAAAGKPAPLLLHNDVQALYPSWFAVPGAKHITLSPKGATFDPTANGLYDGQRLWTGELDSALSKADRIWIVDAEPAAEHVHPQELTKHLGWIETAAPRTLELPMSWVKLKLRRFEKRKEATHNTFAP
jgi:hypothetical protein